MCETDIRKVQLKILEIMKFVDCICRENSIEYYIMGGTALGAIRHGGFIPWDDDLDIFMTPANYEKFVDVLRERKDNRFVLQEWKVVDEFVEYSKVRMNGTTFIESAFKNCEDMHHGIYVDIMILHKCPNKYLVQKYMYLVSKYVTLVALSQRNWKPKTIFQKIMYALLKIMPNKIMSKKAYQFIYKYKGLNQNFSYCYYITKANFKQGIFEQSMFDKPIDIKFEDVNLMGPTEIKKYLELRYGNYMKMPSEEEQKIAIHAEYFDTERGYENYFETRRSK